jgi:4-azaleucine resistance transporter AzlC
MTVAAAHSRRAEFWAGAKATLPLIAGAVPFGIVFGAVAINAGLTPGAAAGMSALVYAGSAQFIAVGLVAQQVTTGFIILTTFVVNLRHALYAASLAPHLKHLPQRWLLPLGFWLTDETFAVVITRFEAEGESPHKHWFYLGSALAMYGNWQLCTWIGIVAGQQIPNPRAWGLDFAMIVTFIGIVAPLVRSRAVLASVIVSGAVAVLAHGLKNEMGLMVAALLGIAAGAVTELIWPEAEEAVITEGETA